MPTLTATPWPETPILGYRPNMPVTILQDRQGYALSLADELTTMGMLPRLAHTTDDISSQTQALIIPMGLCPMDDMYQTSQFVQSVRQLLHTIDRSPFPGFVILAMDLGGGFGLRDFQSAQAPLGGLIGLVEHYASTWTDRGIKLLDIQHPTPTDAAEQIAQELHRGGHATRVAFHGDTRFDYQRQSQPLGTSHEAFQPNDQDTLVVLGAWTANAAKHLEHLSNTTSANLIVLHESPTTVKHLLPQATWHQATSSVDDIFDAFGTIRRDTPPITGLIFLPHVGDSQDPRLGTLSLALAATLSDPVHHIMLLHDSATTLSSPAHHMTQAALNAFAQAEQRRRHDRCSVKSLTLDTTTPPHTVLNALCSPPGVVNMML